MSFDSFDHYQQSLKPVCCDNCSKIPAKLFGCSSCHAVKYCNADCQRAHWRRHKKQCEELGMVKARWESVARKDLEKMKNSTGMFILGLRLGIGDGMPRNPTLACELYAAAVQVQSPIVGGHPIAMLHLALHYERGIGVDRQDYQKAFELYMSILQHPDTVGEENMRPALLALSRFYKLGIAVEKSEEMANKYSAFAGSNAENAAELKGLEQWWSEGGGRETWLSRQEKSEE